MKAKQLVVLIVMAIVLGGAGLWVRRSQQGEYSSSTARMGTKVLGDFDVNAIAALRIIAGTNEPVEVVKKGDDWTVPKRGGYPANFQAVGEFVRKLWELDIKNPIKAGPSRLPILELTRETGTLVELLDAGGKALKSIVLGKKHSRETGAEGGGFPDGRYVKAGEVIALVGDVLSAADNKPQDWMSKDFFKVEKPVSVDVKYAVETNSFRVVRENEFGEWKLEEPRGDEKLDSGKAGGFSSLLSYPSFNDVILDKKPEELGLDKPTVAEVRTSEGFKYEFRVGRADGESYPMQLAVAGDFPKERMAGKDEKPEDKTRLDKEFSEKQEKLKEKLKNEQALGRWVYQVNKWTLDALLKERHTLMAEKKADEKPAAGAPGASVGIPEIPAELKPPGLPDPLAPLKAGEAVKPELPPK